MCTGLEIAAIAGTVGSIWQSEEQKQYARKEKKKAEAIGKKLEEEKKQDALAKQKLVSDKLRMQLVPTTSSINPTGQAGLSIGATSLTGSVLG